MYLVARYFLFLPGRIGDIRSRRICSLHSIIWATDLTERQRELLRRALDEQFPFLIEVTPSVGSAIFTSDIFFIKGSGACSSCLLINRGSMQRVNKTRTSCKANTRSAGHCIHPRDVLLVVGMRNLGPTPRPRLNSTLSIPNNPI